MMLLNLTILYFVWEDQSNAAYCIVHTVLINCITVLYKSYSTVTQLIGQIYSYALNWENTAHLGKCSTVMRRIYLRNVMKTTHCKLLKPAKLILPVRSTARNR